MHMTRVNKRYTTLISLMVMVSAVAAQEFWMQPLKFIYSLGEKARINFVNGENFIGEPVELKKTSIEKLEHHRLAGVSDLKPTLVEGKKDHLEVELKEEGTHVLAMQSIFSLAEMEADKFNIYLKENGLDDAYAAREKAGALARPGKESQAKYTKLLLQVGAKKDDGYKMAMGFPIEIVPEQNPYALKLGDNIRFKIMWNKKPLFGARVKVWNRKEGLTTLQNIYTEQNGTMETRISSKGMWMVQVVYMVPSKDGQTDWRSYCGSLVFGIE
jgi:uncharacterized GH25 family protein